MTELKSCPFCGCEMKIEAVTIDYIETALLVGNPRHKDGCMIGAMASPRSKDIYDEISYLCCSHGVCVDCEVPPNFYCAYGKRRAEKEPPEEGET